MNDNFKSVHLKLLFLSSCWQPPLRGRTGAAPAPAAVVREGERRAWGGAEAVPLAEKISRWSTSGSCSSGNSIEKQQDEEREDNKEEEEEEQQQQQQQ